MCGIAGYYSTNGLLNRELLQAMTTVIQHRGPDAFGYFFSDARAKSGEPLCGLGHRRLSIIDLQARSNQPMHSQCGRYTIAYNGEVYNFQQIAAELQQEVPDFTFRTTSDTEVILEAYARWGRKSFEKLNGIFAFAIFDRQTEQLVLCRDRVGVKPLFYWWNGSDIAFGSELKTIRQIPNLKLELNHAKIGDFLHFGFIPTPFTIYKDIFKLPAGSYAVISKNGMRWQKYWELADKVAPAVTTGETRSKKQLSDLMRDAVQLQLISDVPIGVFLSGGIDSSLVTAQAVELSPNKVKTFSIGFKENRFDESRYAVEVAKHLKTDHHEYIVSYQNAMELMDNLDDVYDEPFADSSAIPTLLVSSLARSQVTVVLSGEGADELFFGYGSYRWAQRLNNPIINLSKGLMAAALPYMPNRYRRATELFRRVPKRDLYSHIYSQEQYYFSTYEVQHIMKDGVLVMEEDHTSRHFEEELFFENYSKLIAQLRTARVLNPMEQQSLFDVYCYLQDDLLVKVDRASMRYALETRVPYLDSRIVEYALNLDPSLKYKGGVAKYLLKEVLYSKAPKALFDRPKQGFAIPLQDWLLNELSFLIDDNLNYSIVSRYGLVRPDMVQMLVQRFRNGEHYLYNRLWLLIVLHKWLRKNMP
ncbi:MAG: asparagine synthase (glutamine-hydrolyzing) [Chitinophagales bacterium]